MLRCRPAVIAIVLLLTTAFGQTTERDGVDFAGMQSHVSSNHASDSGLPIPDPAVMPQGSIVGWGSQVVGIDLSSGFTSAATGGYHSLGLKTDGSIVAWGDNHARQCIVPSPNSGFMAIAAGYGHSLGLKANRSIVGWGDNTYGQRTIPSPNSGFVAIAAGDDFSLGLKDTGSIIAWGDNNYGQTDVPLPNTGVVAIAAAGNCSLGLKMDGSLVAWPSSLGCDVFLPSSSGGFVAIAAGRSHFLGLKPNGSIVAWLGGGFGETSIPSPNSGFVAIAAGGEYSMGLKANGSIVAWGRNDLGQRNVPLPNGGFVAIAAGDWHSLGLKTDGSIVAWGNNSSGQSNVPLPNSGFVAAAGGGYYSLGLRANGSIVAWGQSNVPSNSDFVAIAAGWSHSLGLKTDGSILAWDGGVGYPLGLPTPNSSFIAISAGSAGDYNDLGLRADGSIVAWDYFAQSDIPSPDGGFVAIESGYSHHLGLKADGSIVAWGSNSNGQTNVPSPNSGFVAIAAGEFHSLALRANGSIACWGWNNTGQCNVRHPNEDFVAMAGGLYHSLGLKADGSIVGWGNNSYGQTTIPLPNNSFVAIAAGDTHSLGIRSSANLCAPICGAKKNVACLDGIQRSNGDAVGLMIYGDSTPWCTAWVFASPDIMVTNAHCVRDDACSQISTGALRVRFFNECDSCQNGSVDTRRRDVLVENIVFIDEEHDFALLQMTEDIALDIGHPAITCDDFETGEECYLIHHASGGGQPSSLVMKGFDNGTIVGGFNNPGSKCPPGRTTTVPGLHYALWSKGGASGAPVFNATHEVGAINNRGEQPTSQCADNGYGVPMSSIVPIALRHLQGRNLRVADLSCVIREITVFVACLEGPLTSASTECRLADLTFDQVIDLADFALFQNVFQD